MYNVRSKDAKLVQQLYAIPLLLIKLCVYTFTLNNDRRLLALAPRATHRGVDDDAVLLCTWCMEKLSLLVPASA